MRLRSIEAEDYNDAQRAAIAGAVAGARGRPPAPMRAWIHSPILASRAEQLGGFLRYGTSLPPALSEMAILLTARSRACSFVWNAHKAEAIKGGLDPQAIEVIGQGGVPVLEDAALRIAHDYVVALLGTNRVPAALHREAAAALGETGVVELVGVVGYYSLVALTVNAFAFPIQPGGAAIFGDPEHE
jgi:4-carboxymuconolactone decarboxylase